MSDTILDKKFECFDLEVENKIAKLTLNRPEKLNSMIRSFWDELPEIITAIDQEALARVIVISSTGKHFSAGMDLSVFSQNDVTSSDNKNKKGAIITAIVVGAVAIGVYVATIMLNG